jgi:hypothetical protein
VLDYLTSHLTKANVESFVSRNASSWGTEYLFVRMSWGYKRRLLDAEVVALTLVNNNSEMGYQELAVANGNARPLLVRKQSPPLGIPLAAMDDMQDKYAGYIQDIVQSDLAQYVPVAYTDQDSLLPQRLLGAVCAFYTAGSETDNEVSDVLFLQFNPRSLIINSPRSFVELSKYMSLPLSSSAISVSTLNR